MQSVAIVGGGLMGAGIAAAFAAARHPVRVFEPDVASRSTLAQRVLENLRSVEAEHCAPLVTITEDLNSAVATAAFVTEAAPERLPVKRAIFAELIKLAPPRTILASNTSVIPIGAIAADFETAERIVGTHWWNPACLIPLVEVVQGAHTSDATIAATMALLTTIGKKPAHVRKDIPGFIANRLQHALWREAIAMVADGVCDAQTLDLCVRNSFGLRLPVLGPLENADLVGLDLTLDIHKTIIPALDRHEGPHEHLRALVASGQLGCKSGHGFRAWTSQEISELRSTLTKQLQSHSGSRGS
jgi:3-hydroxybutyryl-CoA dehydrogenase